MENKIRQDLFEIQDLKYKEFQNYVNMQKNYIKATS